MLVFWIRDFESHVKELDPKPILEKRGVIPILESFSPNIDRPFLQNAYELKQCLQLLFENISFKRQPFEKPESYKKSKYTRYHGNDIS